MPDREKVIKGLECCIIRNPDDKARCNDCPYEGNCVNRLKLDGLALLKELDYIERYNDYVVRCKDCGYSLETGTKKWIQCVLPYRGAPLRDINYYCADGKRK